MKPVRTSSALLMLAIVCWGTLLGGAAYSNLVFFPAYLAALPDSTVVIQGPYGIDETVFWGAIHPAVILSLLAAAWGNWKNRTRRKLIVTSAVLYVLVMVVSVLYFFPELFAFADSPNQPTVSPEEWFARGQRWRMLSWLRAGVMYAGIVPLLLALARPVEVGEASTGGRTGAAIA